jgi:hypothetical protein
MTAWANLPAGVGETCPLGWVAAGSEPGWSPHAATTIVITMSAAAMNAFLKMLLRSRGRNIGCLLWGI